MYNKLATPIEIRLGNHSKIYARGKGTIDMSLTTNNDTVTATLHDVFYVPDIKENLFSIQNAIKRGFSLKIENNTAVLYNKNTPILTATSYGNLYYINGSVIYPQSNVAIDQQETTRLWHERLGHINAQNLQTMVNQHSVEGLPKLTETLPFCEGCTINKLTRIPFPTSQTRSSQVLQLIHTDVCGPMRHQTQKGSRYFITFIDDYSRKAHVYFLKNKHEAYDKFIEFKTLVENETNKRIKILRSDGGGEYVNHKFRTYLQNYGIKHQVTVPYSPQQNGVAERFNRTVVEMTRTLLHSANLPYTFWAEAINTATYIRNRCVSSALENTRVTPEELWTGNKPDVSNLRKFGCTAYVLINNRHKLQPKARKCIFLGYETNTKGYRLWNTEINKVFISRDVKFNEERHSGFETHSPEMLIEMPNSTIDKTTNEDIQDTIIVDTSSTSDTPDTSKTSNSKKTRLRKQLETDLGPYWKTDEQSTNIAFALSAIAEPTTYEEAIESEDAHHWKNAMNDEHASLLENNTWELTTLPPNQNIIPTRWLYRIKYNSDGTINRYKARLVAKGFAQIYGMDYDETYAPVFKFTSLRTILTIGAIFNLEIHQMDVKTAFLNGDIDTEIYIEPPQGYRQKPDQVCKLRKGLYGLKQSPRLWNKRINDYLTDNQFKRCVSDPCIYYRHYAEKDFDLLSIWVDDIVIIAPLSRIETIKKTLSKEFKMTDEGNLSYILGINVTRDRNHRTIHLNQPRYIDLLLERFNMTDANPSSTPSDVNVKLQKPQQDNIAPNIPYRQAVGSLMYLMLTTRPDIAAALNKISQYSSNFDNSHWTAAKRILRYIKGTRNHGLSLGGNSKSKSDVELLGYCDSDYAGDLDDRRSTTGYLFFINECLVSWQTHKQATVATSTSQAEYQAVSSASREAIWLRTLLNELGFRQQNTTTIHQDNMSSISLAHNPVNHRRTKHIDIIYHHIRELIESKEIMLTYCPTDQMTADIMTKPLPRHKFELHRSQMGIKTFDDISSNIQ